MSEQCSATYYGLPVGWVQCELPSGHAENHIARNACVQWPGGKPAPAEDIAAELVRRSERWRTTTAFQPADGSVVVAMPPEDIEWLRAVRAALLRATEDKANDIAKRIG